MATPTKQQMTDCETVVGHLHAVSPLKTSPKTNNRYFEATLQTGREEFNRVVCFAPEKRNQFVHAADHSQAVKLVNVRKGISKYWFGFSAFFLNGMSDSAAVIS